MRSCSGWVAAVMTVLMFAPALRAQNPNNPLDVALLRWYPGDISALFTANLGPSPDNLAFDGANMWVANAGANSVTKLASTGAVLGTYSVGGPSANAGGVAFDGTFIWVSNQTPSTGTTLLASTGAIVGVFQLGPSTNTPFGVAFDGANIWVGYGQGSHLPAAGVYKL